MALLYGRDKGERKMSGKKLYSIILAAGKGTRLRTEGCDLPKVMRLADGKPLLFYVLQGLGFIDSENTVIVVGYQKEKVLEGFPAYAAVEQAEQLGTGHAVACAQRFFEGKEGAVLVCCGDMPLIKKETYEALAETYRETGAACVILTGTSPDYLPYGRILRDEQGEFIRMVEEKDCTPEQKQIKELNSGVYIFDVQKLFTALKSLNNQNAQGEYYLTDVPAILKKQGEKVALCKRELGDEIIGVNTPEQLAQVERILRERV